MKRALFSEEQIITILNTVQPILFLLATAAGLLNVAKSAHCEMAAHRPASTMKQIVHRPIQFGDRRKKLTLEYIRTHYNPAARDIVIAPRIIVVHWTGSRSFRSAWNTFNPESISPLRWKLWKAGKVNVSAHFLVDRDGTIYQLMPETWMARHTIGLNQNAIGIENVGAPSWPLTPEQVEANAQLVRYLVKRYPEIEYLIGHYEYLNFRGTPLWRERDNSYYTGKIDPGKDFMDSLRNQLTDLHLHNRYERK